MTARDARGRFVSADEAAATRVLEAAVAEAVRLITEGDRGTFSDWTGRVIFQFRHHNRAEVEAILTHAQHAANLLYGEAS